MPIYNFNSSQKKEQLKTIAGIVLTVWKSSVIYSILHIVVKLAIPSFSLLSVYIFNLILKSLISPQAAIGKTAFFAISYVAVILLSQLIAEVYNVIEGKLTAAVEMHTTVLYNKTVADLPLWYIDSPNGEYEMGVYFTSFEFYMNIYLNLLNLISTVYTITASILVISRLGYFFIFAAVLIFALPSIVYMHKSRKEEEELFLKQQTINAMKGNYLSMLTSKAHAMDTRLYNVQNVFYNKYREWSDIYYNMRRNMINKYKTKIILYSSLIVLAQSVFIVYCISQTVKGAIQINDLSLLCGYMFMSVSSFVGVSTVFSNIVVRTGWVMEYSTIKHSDFYSDGSDNEKQKVSEDISDFESLIFQNVHFTYPGTEKEVLSGVSFELNRGEKISLVGVNGAGKTTCIKLILGIYRPSSGEILLNHIPIEKYTDSSLRKLFASMFQNYIIFPFTLRDNILLGKKFNGEMYEKALQTSGVTKFLGELKNGSETVLARGYSSDGIELSAGQKQSVALARIYYKNSPIEIYDEPSSSLDVLAEDEFVEYYKKISGEKSCILISHRLSAVKSSDKILVLDQGIIAEEGTHEQLMEHDGIYKEMFTSQQQGFIA